MARAGLGRKGISEAIVTVMLVSVTLSSMIAALFFAQLNLSMQAEATEFENGKASMLSLAQMIESLGFAEGTAAYTRFTMSTGGLAITPGTEQLKVYVEDTLVLEDTVNLVRLRGGSGITSSGYALLKPMTLKTVSSNPDVDIQNYLVISPDDPAPLGWVYLKRENWAWVILDFGRVRVVPSGVVKYADYAGNWHDLDVVEIAYVKIVRGTFGGSNVYDVCAKVKSITTTPIYLEEQIGVTIRVERGEAGEEPLSKSCNVAGQGSGEGTLIMLTVVEVEVSTR